MDFLCFLQAPLNKNHQPSDTYQSMGVVTRPWGSLRYWKALDLWVEKQNTESKERKHYLIYLIVFGLCWVKPQEHTTPKA